MNVNLSKTDVDRLERIRARIERTTGLSVSVPEAVRWIIARHDAQMKIDDAPRSRAKLIRTGPAATAIEQLWIGCIRAWHVGHVRRDRINLLWRTIELRHAATQVVICSIDVDRDEDNDVLAMIIESKAYMYLKQRPLIDRLVEVRALFTDGTHEHSEAYSFLAR